MLPLKIESEPKYYKYLAKLYFKAAEAADLKVGIFPGYELSAPPPVMTLCAHSIELSLKAFLLDKSVSKKEVRKLGHDLVACWDRCVKCGADASLVDHKMLKIISELHKSGYLRYGEKNKLGLLPIYGKLSCLCRKCLTLCGAPSLEEIFGV